MTPTEPKTTPRPAQRWLTGIVIGGAVLIATTGFAGSYAAVRHLALAKGFGWFASIFPAGIDAGIVVLLALDLLLTWQRMRFPLLRQTAWLLTAATIAFNAASAWPDPLGVGMHAIIPVLFVVTVEAARHAVGRVADITADRHMESIRLARWLLAPWPTFRLWRRMKLWELRSYDDVVRLERERLVYRARLRARYGRGWRRSAPVESLLPLRLARYGVPVTAPVAAAQPLQGAPDGVLQSALAAPPVALPAAPADAPQSATVDIPGRHDDAPVAPPVAATERHAEPATPAPVAATTTPRKAPAKRPSGGKRGAAKDAIKALYRSLGRRPLESEMVDELKRIRSPHISRQYANKLRKEIERDHPELAALGSDNVHPLTGTDA